MLQCARTGPGLGWCRVAIASLKMLTTSARFWFWSYNFGIRISRKNVTKSIQFHVDNQNISANTCKMYLNLLPLDDSATSKLFPWLTNCLWILTRNWVIFLQDMRISHSLLHVQWSYLTVFITDSLRRLAMWHVLFTIKNTHLNLALATVNKMAVRFFSSDGWWGELSQVFWWCAILCIFRVVLMLKAI